MKVRDLIIRLLENDLDADVVIETRANTPNKVITVWRDIRSVLNGDNQDSEVTILLDYIHKLTDDRVHVIDRPLRDEKSICYNCVFNYMHEKCMYTDIERDLNNIRGCSTKISARMLKDSGLTDDEFRTLVEAFKYFKMDGGCDACGSQRCPGSVQMIIEGNFCKNFKDYCREVNS